MKFIYIVKGLSIILVIFSHMMFVPIAFGDFILHSICIFFMPLFFFISGLFFRPGNLWNRLYRLAIPFIVLIIVVLLYLIHPYPLCNVSTGDIACPFLEFFIIASLLIYFIIGVSQQIESSLFK